MTTQSHATLPAVDEAAISELEQGLPGGDLSNALCTFADELERRGGALVQLHADVDGDELSSLAHGLKGSAATFCAPALAHAAKALEDKLATRDIQEISTAMRQLSAELHRTVEHLRKLLARRG